MSQPKPSTATPHKLSNSLHKAAHAAFAQTLSSTFVLNQILNCNLERCQFLVCGLNQLNFASGEVGISVQTCHISCVILQTCETKRKITVGHSFLSRSMTAGKKRKSMKETRRINQQYTKKIIPIKAFLFWKHEGLSNEAFICVCVVKIFGPSVRATWHTMQTFWIMQSVSDVT